MKQIELITADIDGTIVNEDRHFTDLTREVLTEYHNAGIKIGIASGRPLIHQKARIRDWKIPFEFDFLIGYSGGQLYDASTGKEDSFWLLSCDTLHEIMDLMSPFLDRVTTQIYLEDYILGTRADSYSVRAAKRNGTELRLCDDLSAYYAQPLHNILFRIPDETVTPAVEEYLSHVHSSDFQFFKTQPNLFEFQDPRVNKGDALRIYCERHGIGLQRTIAFGDLSNDLPLLKAAGTGVAMKNGSDDVKAAADEITEYTNDEDGLARHLLSHYPL